MQQRKFCVIILGTKMGLLLIFLHLWNLEKCIRSDEAFFETYSHRGHFCGCEEAPWALLLCFRRLCFCENVMSHTVHGKRIPSWRFLWSLRCRSRTCRVLRDALHTVHGKRRPSWRSMWSLMCCSRMIRVLRDEPHKSHVNREEASTHQIQVRTHGNIILVRQIYKIN